MMFVFLGLGYFIQDNCFQLYFPANFVISFSLKAGDVPLHKHHGFTIHSPFYEPLSCFHFLAIVNRTSVNIAEQVSVEWNVESYGLMLRSRIAKSCDKNYF